MVKYYLANSSIQGVGIFMNMNIPANYFIDVSIKDEFYITPFGSKLNHSWNANCVQIKIQDKYYIVSKRPIQKGEEITIDYRNTPSWIKKPDSNWK
jgi:hypothetical protein